MQIGLIQVIIYVLLWMWNDYLMTILSLALGGILLSVLLISLISDWLQPSKVPNWYYQLMVASLLANLLGYALFLVSGNEVTWMNESVF